jgi:hypothetical protein
MSSSLILRNTEILIFQDIIQLAPEINVTGCLVLTESACDVTFRQIRQNVDSKGF